MWNTFQTDAYEGMIAETIGITGHDGKPIHAYYSRPIGEGPSRASCSSTICPVGTSIPAKPPSALPPMATV